MSKREKFTIVGRRPRYTAAQIRRMAASMARRIDFLRVRSYGDGDAPWGSIEITKDAEIEFSGFHLKRGFLAGYGMDYGEAFRQLPEIHAVPLPGCRTPSDGGRR